MLNIWEKNVLLKIINFGKIFYAKYLEKKCTFKNQKISVKYSMLQLCNKNVLLLVILHIYFSRNIIQKFSSDARNQKLLKVKSVLKIMKRSFIYDTYIYRDINVISA